MPKLSRRTWNNILIFVVLLMMFSLYDWSGQQQEQAEPIALIAQPADLLSVSVATSRLVKTATGWQLQGDHVTSVQAQQMASAWQYSILQPVPDIAGQNWQPLAQASVQFNSVLEPQIWLLYHQGSTYLLQQAGQSQLYHLSAVQARLLFLLE